MEKYRIIKKGIERKHYDGQTLKGCAVEVLGDLMYISNTLRTFDGKTYVMLLWAGAGGVLLSLISYIEEGTSVFPAAIVDEQGREQDCVKVTKYL